MWPSFKEQKVFAVLFVIFFFSLIGFFTSRMVQAIWETAHVDEPTPFEHQITVEGEGKSVVVPDVAKLSFGVETRGKDIPTIQKTNSQTMNNLLVSVKETGISEEDIQTTFYNVYQETVWDVVSQQSRKGDWIISQEVSLTVRQKENVPLILETLGQKGVTSISGPSFLVEDQENSKKEARKKALEQAKQKAEQIAQDLHLELGEIVGYNEWLIGSSDPMAYEKSLGYGMGGGSVAPDIESGSKEIKLGVSLIYTLEE